MADLVAGNFRVRFNDGVPQYSINNGVTWSAIDGFASRLGATALTGAASQTVQPFTEVASAFVLNGALLGGAGILVLDDTDAGTSGGGTPGNQGHALIVTVIVLGNTGFNYDVRNEAASTLFRFFPQTLPVGCIGRFAKFFWNSGTAQFVFFSEWGYLQ